MLKYIYIFIISIMIYSLINHIDIDIATYRGVKISDYKIYKALLYLNYLLKENDIPCPFCYQIKKIELDSEQYPLPQNIIGLCTIYPLLGRRVIILSNKLSERGIVITLLHEIAHCGWGVPHDDTTENIMSSYSSEYTQYEILSNWQTQIELYINKLKMANKNNILNRIFLFFLKDTKFHFYYEE